MKALKHAALCATVVFLCTAQTPAPSAPQVVAVPFKAARHLEYDFAVSYITSGEGHAGAIGSDGSGIRSLQGSGGRRGSLDLDVTALTTDGGLVVAVNENLHEAPRPGQRFTCIVYGDGHMTCASQVAPLTDVENSLLTFLGRGFIDLKKMDAQNHWRQAYNGKEISVVSDFTVTDAPEGQPVTILEQSKINSDVPGVGNTVADAKISYDVTMDVPDTIHRNAKETFPNSTLQTTMDLQLTKDSYAKP